MTYTVYEWSPVVAGDEVAQLHYVSDVVEVAATCAAQGSAQITSPEWGCGYVTTWPEGGASAKFFPNSDEFGFGGDIPPDAALMVQRLEMERGIF